MMAMPLVVAMGMATSPGLLLVDEPTSQLDKTNRDVVVELIAVVGRQFGTTVVVVTHEAREAPVREAIDALDALPFARGAARMLPIDREPASSAA
jgi:ABC-type lipoprotein export system ATPase subunit